MNRMACLAATVALCAGSHAVLAQSELIDGQVIRIDESAGKITIRHGPARKLGMDDGMTMVYRAQDPGMLHTVKPGDRIRFDAGQVNGQYTVTRIDRVK